MPVLRFVPVFALAALCALPHLRGQHQESVVPVIPENESPFFVLNDTHENPARGATKLLDSPEFQYPRNKGSEQSATQMFTHFFTDMFSSVRLVKKHSTSALKVEPDTFSLDDRREVTVTFTVENRTNKLLKLDFPTSQRIEILVRDPSGKIIEKWSDDRAFQDVSGVVMINPGEHIQYEEKIPTRDMQPGQTYVVEASMANNPEFTKTATVKPSGKPRALPNPALDATPAPSPTPNQG
jgi:hypothetical protein